MDSVFPMLNSAELPPYIWGNDDREKVSLRYCSQDFSFANVLVTKFVNQFALDKMFTSHSSALFFLWSRNGCHGYWLIVINEMLWTTC